MMTKEIKKEIERETSDGVTKFLYVQSGIAVFETPCQQDGCKQMIITHRGQTMSMGDNGKLSCGCDRGEKYRYVSDFIG